MTLDEKMRAQNQPAFRFTVSIDDVDVAAFTECTLPVIEWEIEQVKEGGLNSRVHQLPGRRKPARLTLKNGIGKGQLLDWYTSTMDGKYSRRRVTITLYHSPEIAFMVWNIAEALPIRWTGPQLRSDANTIAIHTLELACGEIDVKYPDQSGAGASK